MTAAVVRCSFAAGCQLVYVLAMGIARDARHWPIPDLAILAASFLVYQLAWAAARRAQAAPPSGER